MKIRVLCAFFELTAIAAGVKARVPCRFTAYHNAQLLELPP